MGCALAGARLLIPVVALLAGAAAEDQALAAGPATPPGPGPRPGSALRREKVSEMALPTLIGNDGRSAVLAFTSLSSLLAWRPGARPVPVPASQAAMPAGPGCARAGEPAIAEFGLRPGDDGTDLTVQLALATGYQPGGTRAQEAVSRAAARIMAAGGARIRRGISVAISAGSGPGQPVGSP